MSIIKMFNCGYMEPITSIVSITNNPFKTNLQIKESQAKLTLKALNYKFSIHLVINMKPTIINNSIFFYQTILHFKFKFMMHSPTQFNHGLDGI